MNPCDLLTAIACACGDTLWRLRLIVGEDSPPPRQREEGPGFWDEEYRFRALRRLELVGVSEDDAAIRRHVQETLGASSQCDIVLTHIRP